ncbi:MAG: ABC transporter permease [Gemmatimonadaceae bacterium]
MLFRTMLTRRALADAAVAAGRDLRYAARSLRATPAFTVAAAATLAIGIGASTAIFSVVDGVLLKPLPFSHPERVVALFQTDRKKGLDHGDVAPANFVDWRARSGSFASLAAVEPFALSVLGSEGVEQIFNWNVTRDFFSVLDTRPVLGRLFIPTDFAPGPPRVLVLTYASWQRRFGADPNIIGKQLRLATGSAVIVGVLPAGFAYLADSKMEIYAPKVLDTTEMRIRNIAWYHVVGRLKPAPGVTLDAARADASRIGAQLAVEYPGTNANAGVTVEPLDQAIVGDAGRAVLLLFGAVGMVLLIACVNVANLVLTRTARRSRELAIRAALGASPGRIARQLLAEHFLLASIGGLVGAALAVWSVRAIHAVSPASIPRLDAMRVDGRALVFTLASVVVATLLFGLLPAMRAGRSSAQNDLRSGDRSAGGATQSRLRRLLVVTEVALAVMLLVGAGLLMRSFVSVIGADRGYESDHVLAATVFVYAWNPTPRSRANFINELVSRAAALPGVTAAGATSSLPLDIPIDADQGKFTADGQSVRPGEEPSVHMTAVTPGAFDALRIALHRGRLFSASDDSAHAPVAIINEAMARRYWPGTDPVGQRVRLAFSSAPEDRQIIGVVADTRQTALDAPAEPILYVPHEQASTGAMVIVLRTVNEPLTVVRDLKRVVEQLNPALPLANVETLDELAAASIKPRQFTLVLLAVFAACAFVLALIGVYAVISQGTADRRREFGVRIALGAQGSDVIAMVMRQGLLPAVSGVVMGIAGSAALSAILRSMLFGVQPLDAPTFAEVAGLMLTTAMIACYIPARRATRVNPLETLRAP